MKFDVVKTSGNLYTLDINSKPHPMCTLRKSEPGPYTFLKNNTRYYWEAELNTLEELLDFKKMAGEPIIISDSCYGGNTMEIEIYDCYRE